MAYVVTNHTGAAEAVQRAAFVVLEEGAERVVELAESFAPFSKSTYRPGGTLKESIHADIVKHESGGYVISVIADPVNEDGFHYGRAAHDGHGPIKPKNEFVDIVTKKGISKRVKAMLIFDHYNAGKDPFYTDYVKPTKGNKFLLRALRATFSKVRGHD